MTRDAIVRLLMERQGQRSLRAFAEEVGCSPAYLYDIYASRREPGKKVLQYLGFRKTRKVEVNYVKERA